MVSLLRPHQSSSRPTRRRRAVVLAAVAGLLGVLGAAPAGAGVASGVLVGAVSGAPTPAAGRLDNSPTQPALIAYGAARHAGPYARRGALVVAGRENFGSREMKRVSRAGGTVLVYVDPMIDNAFGRYHQLLNRRSDCGPATSIWPGRLRANQYGLLNDFRMGSAVQRKLGCVLRTIVRQNPHIGGFFADDVGSRSYFPGFSWDRMSDAGQRAYRAGAIGLMKTFRRVADDFGLVVMVNGTWEGGSLGRYGGGYPDASRNGNALADGTLSENHPADAFWGRSYPCAEQWAEQSRTTRGTHFNFAVTRDEASRRAFARSGCYAFAATQRGYDRAERWGPSHSTGLPSRVTRRR